MQLIQMDLGYLRPNLILCIINHLIKVKGTQGIYKFQNLFPTSRPILEQIFMVDFCWEIQHGTPLLI